ncbi:MAG: hypothetical protein ACKERG_01155 [Candidatus Hodgkinia cicadicola]
MSGRESSETFKHAEAGKAFVLVNVSEDLREICWEASEEEKPVLSWRRFRSSNASVVLMAVLMCLSFETTVIVGGSFLIYLGLEQVWSGILKLV